MSTFRITRIDLFPHNIPKKLTVVSEYFLFFIMAWAAADFSARLSVGVGEKVGKCLVIRSALLHGARE